MSNKAKEIYYSDKYTDDEFEYRHVHIPKELAKMVPKGRLMTEKEWRAIGIQQSRGWEHYLVHGPEKHVVLFRRLLPHAAPSCAGVVDASISVKPATVNG